jgi:hypothetical protein
VDECVEGRALLDDGHCGAQGPCSLHVVKRVPQVVVVVFLQEQAVNRGKQMLERQATREA